MIRRDSTVRTEYSDDGTSSSLSIGLTGILAIVSLLAGFVMVLTEGADPRIPFLVLSASFMIVGTLQLLVRSGERLPRWSAFLAWRRPDAPLATERRMQALAFYLVAITTLLFVLAGVIH